MIKERQRKVTCKWMAVWDEMSHFRRPSCEVRSERCCAECCSECFRRLRSSRKPRCRFEMSLKYVIGLSLLEVSYFQLKWRQIEKNWKELKRIRISYRNVFISHFNLRSSSLLGHLAPNQQVEVLEYSRTRRCIRFSFSLPGALVGWKWFCHQRLERKAGCFSASWRNDEEHRGFLRTSSWVIWWKPCGAEKRRSTK